MARIDREERRQRRAIEQAAQAYVDAVHRNGHLDRPVSDSDFRAWLDLNGVDRVNIDAVRHEVAVAADACWKCRLAPWGVRTDQQLREKRATKANSASGAREIRELKATVSHLSPEEARRGMIERLGLVAGE